MSNPFQSPQSPMPPVSNRGHGVAIAGFVLGLLNLVAWCIPLFGFPMSIAGLVCSIKGRGSSQSGLALAGIILNSIALVLTLISAILGAYLAVSGQHPLLK
jgi:hypothetical protein